MDTRTPRSRSLVAASLAAIVVITTIAAFIPARAQSSAPPDAAPATACPVIITDAHFTRFAKPQPVPAPNATTEDKAYGSLHVEYRNASGKPVRSFDFSVKLAPEKSFRPPLLRIPDDLVALLSGRAARGHRCEPCRLFRAGQRPRSHLPAPRQSHVRGWLYLDQCHTRGLHLSPEGGGRARASCPDQRGGELTLNTASS